MKVLGINSSPRVGGNTDILLTKVLDGAASKGAKTEKIMLNELKFVPCQECEKVKDDGSCKVQDDMQKVYKKVAEADAIVFASPIFFGSLSAQAKMMIDRYQCLWRAKYMTKTVAAGRKRPGAFVCVEASMRQDFFENAIAIVKNLFATLDVAYSEELLCPGIDAKGKVLESPACLKEAFGMGERIIDKGKTQEV